MEEPIKDIGDVQQCLYALAELDKKDELFRKLRNESDDFYSKKLQAVEASRVYLRTRISTYLEVNGLPSLPTPAGTVSRTRRLTIEYDAPAETIVNQLPPEDRKDIVTHIPETERINLLKLRQYLTNLHASGVVLPEGVRVEVTEGLSIRKPESAEEGEGGAL